jgi:hypothetical protein
MSTTITLDGKIWNYKFNKKALVIYDVAPIGITSNGIYIRAGAIGNAENVHMSADLFITCESGAYYVYDIDDKYKAVGEGTFIASSVSDLIEELVDNLNTANRKLDKDYIDMSAIKYMYGEPIVKLTRIDMISLVKILQLYDNTRIYLHRSIDIDERSDDIICEYTDGDVIQGDAFEFCGFVDILCGDKSPKKTSKKVELDDDETKCGANMLCY